MFVFFLIFAGRTFGGSAIFRASGSDDHDNDGGRPPFVRCVEPTLELLLRSACCVYNGPRITTDLHSPMTVIEKSRCEKHRSSFRWCCSASTEKLSLSVVFA